jgi:hypothetical protein
MTEQTMEATFTEEVTYHRGSHMEHTVPAGTRCVVTNVGPRENDGSLSVSVEVAPDDLDAWTHRDDGWHDLNAPVRYLSVTEDEVLAHFGYREPGHEGSTILKEAGVVWASWAVQWCQEQGVETDGTLQGYIDAVPDHNQYMLDALEEVSPEVRGFMHELMCSEDEKDQEIWPRIGTRIFDHARQVIEG